MLSLMTTALLILAAFLGEFVDSGLGMMYGTILAPLLMVCGYAPQEVVPSILLSQAVGGAVASIGHHRHGNADFSWRSSDFRIAALIFIMGVQAVVVGAYVGSVLPPRVIQLYVGMLVSVMGFLVISHRCYTFAWWKVIGIGVLSAFNKAISGGGYGPLVSSGLVMAGREGRSAIGTTDFAETFICLAAFGSWALVRHSLPSPLLVYPLIAGSVLGALVGPYALSRARSSRQVAVAVGWLALVLGILCLADVVKA